MDFVKIAMKDHVCIVKVDFLIIVEMQLDSVK